MLQPSVIVIEDVDRLFMKKSVRMERWDMRRMRKELPKILRAIVPEDRVLLLGTSSTPWECDQRVELNYLIINETHFYYTYHHHRFD